MKAPFFEGTDSVSMSLYALDRNAVEKSASCELHRVSEAYRPHPPFSAHVERILLEIVGRRVFFRCRSTLISTFTTSLSFKTLLTRRPHLFRTPDGILPSGMPS